MPFIIKKNSKYLQNDYPVNKWTDRLAWADIFDDDEEFEAKTIAMGYEAQVIPIEIKEID